MDVESLPAPDGNSAEKGEKRTTWGSLASVQDSKNFIFQNQLIYPKLYIKKMEYAELCRGSSPDPHWDKQGFLFAYPPVYKWSQVVYIIFLPRGLLTFLWLSSWIIVYQTRKLLFPWSVFSLLCITLKVLNKVTLLWNKVQWVITKKVLNSKI